MSSPSDAAPAIAGAGANDARLCASVLIPTYNRRDLLLATLESLERQSVPFDRYEVIVAVDGSDDGTSEALRTLQPGFPFRWLWQENQGAAAARNAAVRLARHSVLLFLDDDQLATTDLVATHLNTHQRHGVVLVQGLYPLAPGYNRRGSSLVYERQLLSMMAVIQAAAPPSWHVWGNNMSLRRETWLQVGGFDEKLRDYGGEDTDLGLRVAALGVPFVFEPRALSYHRHVVSYDVFCRQAFSAGRALVQVSGKHALPLGDFSGFAAHHALDVAVRRAWSASARGSGWLGRTLVAGLWGADILQIRPAQMTMARLVHRFYKLGGMAAERAHPRAPAP